METNNKLREACANIAEYARSAMCHTTDAHVLGYLNQIEGWAKAALAEPVKNCEVGTAEEQEDRFRRYCNSRGTFCGDCPLYNNRRGECRFAWAQLPYEEGGAKVKISESPCNHCADYLGWIHVRSTDNLWVDRPWCQRHDEVCQPHKHGCIKEGGAK